MTDETKPITSADLGSKPSQTVNVGGTVENKRDTSGDQTVSVKALKAFHKEGDMKGDMAKPGDEFDVPRHRAAQLRANGLIEYANEADDQDIHGKIDAGRIADKVKLQAEASKIPENSKTTPLRNPEVKLADAPADNGKRK
jgi:hypothetical protein